MSDFDSLRDDIGALAKTISKSRQMTVGHLLEQSRQIDKLWTDNAELRDELHAVANRVENLTRAFTIDAAEVAQKIVSDANTATLRAVTKQPYDQDSA